MIFENRYYAGEILAKQLLKLKLQKENSLIAAIPRGGVVVASAIQDSLGISMFPLVIKKIGAPHNPELAIGAVASIGKPVLDLWFIKDLDVPRQYLAREIAKKRKEALEREKFLNVSISDKNFEEKDVVIVDDGLATGQTAKAAARIIRKFNPRRLILAVACASPSVIIDLKKVYDEIICPEISVGLVAVGQFYRDFRPVEDQEVKEILSRHLTINH